MTDNTTPTEMVPETEPTDTVHVAQQARQDHAGLSDSQMQLSERGTLAKPTVPGRMPLFRR